MMTGYTAGGPEISVEDAIRIRYTFQPSSGGLDLWQLPVTDEALAVIPDTVTSLALTDTRVTDGGIPLLLRLTALKRLNLSGTRVTDNGLMVLAELRQLEWICVNRTPITARGADRLKAIIPGLTVLTDSAP